MCVCVCVCVCPCFVSLGADESTLRWDRGLRKKVKREGYDAGNTIGWEGYGTSGVGVGGSV